MTLVIKRNTSETALIAIAFHGAASNSHHSGSSGYRLLPWPSRFSGRQTAHIER